MVNASCSFHLVQFLHDSTHTDGVLSWKFPIRCSLHRYLGGMLDFSGELNRYAVARATQRDAQVCRLVNTCC